MKQVFLMFVVGGILLSIVGFGLWKVALAFYSLYEDWRLGKELDELEVERDRELEDRRKANTDRLDNGCDHRFVWSGGCEPREVCSRCGIESSRPNESCDHVWHRGSGSVPNSYCDRCGKQLSGSFIGINVNALSET